MVILGASLEVSFCDLYIPVKIQKFDNKLIAIFCLFQRSSVVTADSGRDSSRSTLKSTDKEGKSKSSKKMVVCRVALLDGSTFEPKGIDVS